MNHTLKKLSDTKISLEITLDSADLSHAKTHALKSMAPKVKVAGFRPGKVPVAVAEKNIDPSALASETVEAAINHALNDIITSEELRVLDRPSVELGKFDPYESLSFTAEIEILPAVTLADYKKLKAKKQKVSVTQTDIDEVLTRMRQGFAIKSPVTRPAKEGDEAVIDFVGRNTEGESVSGASGTDYPLTIGSKTFIPGFEEGIVGHKPGETFDVSLTFPNDYHADALKGAHVTFETTIKTLNEVTLPEVDDDFAKKAGPFTTADELRADIKKEITSQKERQADDNFKDALLGELAEASNVPLSEVLVQDQMKSIERDTMQNLMYRGVTPEQYMEAQGYKDHDEWHEKEFREAAVRRVKSGLVLAELTKAENIEITQDELEAELTKRKAEAPAMAKQFDSPESRRDIANRVLTQKTIDHLVNLNTK